MLATRAQHPLDEMRYGVGGDGLRIMQSTRRRGAARPHGRRSSARSTRTLPAATQGRGQWSRLTNRGVNEIGQSGIGRSGNRSPAIRHCLCLGRIGDAERFAELGGADANRLRPQSVVLLEECQSVANLVDGEVDLIAKDVGVGYVDE